MVQGLMRGQSVRGEIRHLGALDSEGSVAVCLGREV